MKTRIAAYGLVSLMAMAAALGTASANDDRHGSKDNVQRFATLPEGVRFPEGITADPYTRDIYVSTFDFGPNANKLLRFSHGGRLEAQRDFGGTPLLGLAFDLSYRDVYIANFGASKIQRMPASFNEATLVEDVATIPGIGAPANGSAANPDGSADTIVFGSNSFPAPNALAFDGKGNLYVSDSFQGAIFRIDNPRGCSPACAVITVIHSPLLATAGFPPFGANGLAFNEDESALFVANTGDDRVLKLDMASNTLAVFAESINGADGIVFDERGRLWVAANQNDELVVLNRNGKVIDRVGEFGGVRPDGSPDGLLFPASLVIVGDELFVTNAALVLTPATGDEPEEEVTRYTVSRISMPRH